MNLDKRLAPSASDPLLEDVDPKFEVDLVELAAYFWRKKWLLISALVVSAVFSVLYALSIPNQYRATAILIPATNSMGGTGSGLSGGLSGLASIAGIRIGGGDGTDKVSVAIALIRTWGFLDRFVTENNLESEILGVRAWDPLTNTLLREDIVPDNEPHVEEENTTPAQVRQKRAKSWQIFKAIEERISIARDPSTGFVTLSVEHYSPYVAKQWVDLLVSSLNKFIQERDKEEAQKSISYLTQQIENSELAEMRAVFYQLIEEQTKSLMLTEVRGEYVLATLSEARVPEQRSAPNRTLLVFIGLLFGLVITLLALLFRFLKKQ